MNRRIIGVAAAVLLATLGTLVLVGWVQSAERRALAGEAVVDVLVVTETVDEGTAAAGLQRLVDREQVPAKVRADGAVTSLDELDGLVAAVDLLPGEQITRARFVSAETLKQQAEVAVPDGLQELTVALDPQRVVGGEVIPGDTVGVFLSFEPFDVNDQVLEGGETPRKIPNETHLTFHKVLVTNVQATDGAAAAQQPTTAQVGEDPPVEDEKETGPKPAPQGQFLVTLALDAQQAEKVVFTAEFGRIWLSKEPATATEDGTAIQHRGRIYSE